MENRLKGDDVLHNANRLDFDSIDSHRVIAGARWTYGGTGSFHPYVGAYYEHEFKAKSDVRLRTATASYALREAKAKGSSGVGELGVSFGKADSRFSADVGVEGYVGKRKGVTGRAMVGWSF